MIEVFINSRVHNWRYQSKSNLLLKFNKEDEKLVVYWDSKCSCKRHLVAKNWNQSKRDTSSFENEIESVL